MSIDQTKRFINLSSDDEPVTLYAVGDMMLGDCPVSFGFGVGSQIEKHGADFPFEPCQKELAEADILIGNLETVLSEFDWDKTPFEQMRLRGQPKAAEGLKTAGFDLLTLANNHIMQHGRAATVETAGHLREVGVEITGLEIPEIELHNAVCITKKNLRFGFLSYNQRPEQYFIDPRVDLPADMNLIKQEIKALRGEVDCLVLSLHWGDEFINRPSVKQIVMAHELVDSGVDIILGHHAHVLQGIEEYNGAVIAYSLGNFIFDMPEPICRKGMILKLSIFSSGEIKVDTIPVMINDLCQPQILDQKNDNTTDFIDQLSERILNREADYEKVYQEELEQLTKEQRQKVLRQYLTNAFRYKPKYLLANLAGMIKRRL